MSINYLRLITLLTLALVGMSCFEAKAQQARYQIFPEQKSIQIRDPSQLRTVPIPDVGIPNTVTSTGELAPQKLSLDDAIRIALENANVIRVLGGVTAGSSGQTIYDLAISTTDIDVQNSVFDPVLDFSTGIGKSDQPGATFDPLDATQSIIIGSSADNVSTSASLSKRMFNGADLGLNVSEVRSYFEPGVFPLEPEYRSSAELTFRQPFMRGAGRAANLAPIVVARINTEQSYFRYKDSVQELVRGVINAYWNLVSARVEVWAREQQVDQAQFAYDRAKTRQAIGFQARTADVAQAQSALANFRASLIAAKSTLILNETALRNIMGLPPTSMETFVPTSEPMLDKVELQFTDVLQLAEQQRPDIIELKLVLEADEQLLLQANNQARPQFDGTANYRWDGLNGEMPNGATLRSGAGRFAGFNLGVNFSVPLGLRQGRATLRRRELVIARDRANLEQGMHQMIHQLTVNYRNLEQFYEQISAFKEARDAARQNYENQLSDYATGRRELLNAIQAITDWGNAVSQQARAVTQYNTELANIERQTGTILETHGITFFEERFGSVGPRGYMGLIRTMDSYPQALIPEGGIDLYSESAGTSDDAFELESFKIERRTPTGNSNDAPSQSPNDFQIDDGTDN